MSPEWLSTPALVALFVGTVLPINRGGLVVVVGPLLVWAAVVLPGWI